MAASTHRWRGIVLAAAVLVSAGCAPGETPTAPATTPPATSSPQAAATAAPTPRIVGDGSAPSDAGARTPEATGTPATPKASVPGGARLTPAGFGPLRLGMSEAAATDTGFIGAIGTGCELSGTRGAELRPAATGDAQGQVTFDRGSLAAVTVTDGAATAEGVAVGHTLSRVREVYADATVSVNRTTEETFGVWVVEVTRGDGGAYGMLVDPESRQVTQIAVPRVQFCE